MRTILIQLDTDPLPSTFDRVVAVDAEVDELFSYGGVTPQNVEGLVHGAMFTRGPQDLKHTAIFVGGSNVDAGEELFQRVQKTFFGPVRVSVMLDSNGSNTTAAAAVLAASRHVTLKGAEALVLGGTGPVGRRAAELLAREGAKVRLASRALDRAREACDTIASDVEGSQISPHASATERDLQSAIDGAQLVIAAGAAGVELLPKKGWQGNSTLKVAIDLNAVPPSGIGGVEVMDKAKERDGVLCYGAIGVGGTKMKIHKAALRKLFESNSAVLDTVAIYRIGQEMA